MAPQGSSAVIDDEYGLEKTQPATVPTKDDEYGLEVAAPSKAPPPTPGLNPKQQQRANELAPLKEKISQKTPFEKARENPEGFLSHLGQSAKDLIPDWKQVGITALEGPAAPIIQGVQGLIGAHQEFKAAKERGHGPGYSTAAAANTMLGVNPERMEKAAEVGDTGGVLGEVAIPAAMAAIPEADRATGGKVSGAIGKIGSTAVKKIGEPFHIGMSGEDLVTKGVRPRNSATGWNDAIQRPGVQRAIKEYHENSPIKSNEDFKEAIPEIKDKLWQDRVEAASGRQGARPVDLKPAAKAVRDVITPEMEKFEPKQAQELHDFADKLEDQTDVNGANRLLGYLNGKMESHFSKFPAARRSVLRTNPEVAGFDAAREAVRGQVLDTLEAAGETDVRDARKDYGALKTIEKEVERRPNIDARSKPFSLSRILGGLGAATAAVGGHPIAAPVVYGAGELINHLNKPDVMLRRGIERMNPEPAPAFTPPAKFVPPAKTAPPPLAAVQQTLGLPRPEAGPLFQIEQTPRLRPDVESPRTPPIQGEQVPLNLPPENAPLFNINQTPAPKPQQIGGWNPLDVKNAESVIGKPSDVPSPVFRGTAANVEPASSAVGKITGEALKPGESTFDKFYDKEKDQWSPEREANHEAIAKAATSGKTPPKGRPPEATITVGGTGAGKTTVTRGIMADDPNLVNVDSDANKLKIPEYEGLKKSDPQKAAARVHDESKAISKRIIQEAVGKGLDFVYDTSTGGGGAPLFKKLKDLGYKVRVVYADVPVEEAIKRADLRARESADPSNRGRVVPEDIIRKKHEDAAQAFLEHSKSPHVDEVRAFDTTTRTPEEFYNRSAAGEKINNQKTLDRVREKAGVHAGKQ